MSRAAGDAEARTAAHLALNRAMWDERADVHAASPDYGFQRFLDDPAHLSTVVRFDLPRLGSVDGLRGVHLQCHLGTDTLSLARLGARMSGLDFSGPAVAQARALAERCGAAIDYHQSDVYGAVGVFGPESADLVFTGIGALCWLPDIPRWGQVVADLLRPGGRLFLREGHPMLWSMDDRRDDGLLVVAHPYLPRPEPTEWDEDGTYVSTEHTFVNTRAVEWSHGLGEILTALLDAGLVVTGFEEHTSVPWAALPGMVAGSDGEWRLAERPERMPLTYTLQARKPRGSTGDRRGAVVREP